MSDMDILERFIELKYPEGETRGQEAACGLVRDLMEKMEDTGVMEKARREARQRGLMPEGMFDLWRQDDLKRGLHQQIGPDALEALERVQGATFEQVRVDRQARFARKRNSGKKNAERLNAERDAALRSFIESERAGHNHAEAIRAALDAIACDEATSGEDISERTVALWLRTLREWKVTTIPGPKPGRPKK